MALLVGVTGIVFASDETQDISLTLSSKIWSKYLNEGGGNILHDKPVIQSDIFVSFPRGFYFSVWHSAGLDGTGLSSDAGDEIDYIVGWNGEVKGLNLDFGILYFDLVDLFRSPQGDIIQPYLELSKDFNVFGNQKLAPYVWFGFPYSAKGDEFGHGFYTRLGVKHVWQIGPKFIFSQKANLFFDDGACGFDSGLFGEYRCSLSWQISKSTTIDLISIKAIDPFTPLSDNRKTEIVYGMGVRYHF
ncbi:hypothetical protein AMJ47_00100 [Parcubacteria bacterium DG_72]|nr:MAG: hypothetical protein AMJ47_00100 [Parcubacteria bacterium DG_72]